ncbi:hypothetical protein SUSAZ_04995 [Sulfolobus acidocaldarius SUSAZ]|nr:hypothetical protein SUSAZ_04995 [Sulfolobus acidocaldarius SUSAZ]
MTPSRILSIIGGLLALIIAITSLVINKPLLTYYVSIDSGVLMALGIISIIGGLADIYGGIRDNKGLMITGGILGALGPSVLSLLSLLGLIGGLMKGLGSAKATKISK